MPLVSHHGGAAVGGGPRREGQAPARRATGGGPAAVRRHRSPTRTPTATTAQPKTLATITKVLPPAARSLRQRKGCARSPQRRRTSILGTRPSGRGGHAALVQPRLSPQVRTLAAAGRSTMTTMISRMVKRAPRARIAPTTIATATTATKMGDRSSTSAATETTATALLRARRAAICAAANSPQSEAMA